MKIKRCVWLGLSSLVCAASVLLTSATATASPCLTHQEARQRWPNSHLWWHTENRCWDNRPKGADHYDPRPVMKMPPPKVPDNWAGAPEPNKTLPPDKTAEIYYPELKIGCGPGAAWSGNPTCAVLGSQPRLSWQQPWLSPTSIVYWPQLIDIDQVPFVAWDKRIGQ